MDECRLRLNGPSRKLSNPAEGLVVTEDESSRGSSAWASMGKVTPLHDLDYRAVEPLRIYKFSPKFFLTMGVWTRPFRGQVGDRLPYANT